MEYITIPQGAYEAFGLIFSISILWGIIALFVNLRVLDDNKLLNVEKNKLEKENKYLRKELTKYKKIDIII